MSTLSKKLMSDMGIRPRLRLGKKTAKGVIPTGPHKVIFKADKEATGKEYKLDDGTTKKEYVKYLFIENGEEKTYQTKKFSKDGSLSYFVQHFADIEPGDEVILEMRKSGVINYVDISIVGSGKEVKVEEDDMDDDETPVIEIQ
jgi:hypothetical protein